MESLPLLLTFLSLGIHAQTYSNPNSTDTTNTTPATPATPARCSLQPSVPSPSFAPGWTAQVIANNVTVSNLIDPRGIIFDTEGNLLVIEQQKGIRILTLNEGDDGCVSVEEEEMLIVNGTLTHGIELSSDGRTLYASSPGEVMSWTYDARNRNVTSGPTEIVTGMSSAGHATRTLLLSKSAPGMLLVSWGSQSNVDLSANDVDSGVSQIRAFNISNMTSPYDYSSSGLLLGWGLRNSVGVGEHPVTGGIYSVENSVDELMREGQDIHSDNPGEEMNFHGYLNGTEYETQGGNHGYPNCFAAWSFEDIPENENLQIGTQFAIGMQNATINDTFCQVNHIPPSLTFQAHMAPLDIKFNVEGSTAWVTMHGSWNRDNPVGYKLSAIDFANGSPVAPPNSSTGAIDIMTNPDLSQCPGNCFRPVGLDWDRSGRLFMSSDATGEIYLVQRVDGSSVNGATPTIGLSPSTTSSADDAIPTEGAGNCNSPASFVLFFSLAVTAFLF